MVKSESFIPLYKQIAEKIRFEITGRYKFGDKLPSEVEFIEKYKTSRDTIRKALKLLEYDKLVIIKHGKGIFVNSREIQMNTSNIGGYRGIYELLTSQGLDVEIELLKCEKVIPPNDIINILECSKSEKLQLLQRRYLVNDLPVALFYTYISNNIEISSTQLKEMKTQPIRPILDKIQKMDAMDYTIEIKKSSEYIKNKLNFKKESLIVNANHVSYRFSDQELVPFEMTTMFLIPEIAKFKFRMHI